MEEYINGSRARIIATPHHLLEKRVFQELAKSAESLSS